MYSSNRPAIYRHQWYQYKKNLVLGCYLVSCCASNKEKEAAEFSLYKCKSLTRDYVNLICMKCNQLNYIGFFIRILQKKNSEHFSQKNYYTQILFLYFLTIFLYCVLTQDAFTIYGKPLHAFKKKSEIRMCERYHHDSLVMSTSCMGCDGISHMIHWNFPFFFHCKKIIIIKKRLCFKHI